MTESLQQNLQAHLVEIVRDRDPFLATAGHFYVKTYLHQQLSQWGTVAIHEFEFRGRSHQNFILDLPGQTSKPPILVAAHYDTVPGCPGADDNASGLAVLLEMARAIAHQPARHPLRLVAFDLEEIGVGSRMYAVMIRQQGQKLRLMLSLEMLGYCDPTPYSQKYPISILQRMYPTTGDFIALIGNFKTIPDLYRINRCIRQFLPCEWLPLDPKGLILPDARRSDHAAFWDEGYGAIMVTDTADLRNPHYHQASDRIETLDLTFLTAVCQGLIAVVRDL